VTTFDDRVRVLAMWYRSEYRRRTDAVEADQAPIDWVTAEYRVTWSEVVHKAREMGILLNPVSLRLALEDELRKDGRR